MEKAFLIYRLIILILFALPQAVQDIKTLHINPMNFYFGTIVLFVTGLFFYRDTVIPSLISCGTEVILFVLLYFILKNNLGLGDVKCSLFCGYSTGNWMFAMFSTAIAAVLCILSFICIKIKKGSVKNVRLPFVPFMVAGATVSLILQLFFTGI